MRREEILTGDSIRDSSRARFSVSSTNMRVRLRNCGVLLDTRVPLSIQVTVLNESQILDSVPRLPSFQSAMLPHHPHYQLWQGSFSNVGLHTGTPYPGCTQQDLIDYQQEFSDPNSYPVHLMDQNPFKFISKAATAKLATNFLCVNRQPTPEVQKHVDSSVHCKVV